MKFLHAEYFGILGVFVGSVIYGALYLVVSILCVGAVRNSVCISHEFLRKDCNINIEVATNELFWVVSFNHIQRDIFVEFFFAIEFIPFQVNANEMSASILKFKFRRSLLLNIFVCLRISTVRTQSNLTYLLICATDSKTEENLRALKKEWRYRKKGKRVILFKLFRVCSFRFPFWYFALSKAQHFLFWKKKKNKQKFQAASFQ